MFKNSHLRLLMTISGLQRLGSISEETRDTAWVIPGEVSADYLKDTIHYINQAEFNPPSFEDGSSAESQLRRKTAPRKKAAFDDDEGDDGAAFLDDEVLFPAGGPTARKAIDDPARPKKTRRRRRRNGDEEPDDAAAEERRRKRRERENEKARKIKSALYVREGDDEFDSDEDEAFFAREREIATRAEMAARSATGLVASVPSISGKKRRSDAMLLESDDDDDSSHDDDDGGEADEDDDLNFVKRVLSSPGAGASETDDLPVDGSDDGETRKKRRVSDEDDDEDGMAMAVDKSPASAPAGEEGDEDAPAVTRRPRVRGGFVMDSDDDE